jgi:thiosulfate/3-mercaptopyruvate sulfurtransferase
MASAQPAGAANGGAFVPLPRLVDVAQAAALVGGEHTVILQVGSMAQFTAGHVPGARPVSLNDVSAPRTAGALSLELPEPAALERWARSVGITDVSQILVVAVNDTLQSSTRVVFTLSVMGIGDRVTFLDGGLKAWQSAGHPVHTGPAAPLPATTAPLTLRMDATHLATIVDVERAVQDASTALVDARLPQFYAGNGGGYPRPGHIPSAVNIPLSLVSEGGALKGLEELRELFTTAGVRPGDRVITYCHIGQQATLLWFVARELGFEVRLFDGSFQEWSGSDRPVTGPASRPAGGRR